MSDPYRLTLYNDSYLSQIKDLWKICFSLDDAYIDRFFSKAFYQSSTIIITYKERVISSLSLFPIGSILKSGERLDGVYLYGVCTEPEHRGKGLSRRLIDYIFTHPDYNGQFIITRPASSSLFNHYKNLGFDHSLMIAKSQFNTPSPLKEDIGSFEALSGEVLFKLREKYLGHNSGYVSWSTDMLEYIILDTLSYEGTALYKNDLYFLGSYKSESRVYQIIETSAKDSKELSIIFNYLSQNDPNISSFEVIHPVDTNVDNSIIQEFTLIHFNNNCPALPPTLYFNFPME